MFLSFNEAKREFLFVLSIWYIVGCRNEGTWMLYDKLGYQFKDPALLEMAFTHTSYLNEHRDRGGEDNERLEFLGDAVLNLLITDYLFKNRGILKEGQLSFLRSRMVDAAICAKFLKSLGVEEALLLGRGEKMNLRSSGESLYANLFEALLGAIYIDSGGIKAVEKFFWSHFKEVIEEIAATPTRNYKAELQDKLQKEKKLAPTYEVLLVEGPEHAKTFHVAVLAGTKKLGEGWGLTKKEAQQEAAKQALES